ncbi:hypothetical protein [Dactylosporangium sp. NPDC048998]|uniref:hypothetical protein n=1 Tax=Dactylosporangium sp. NPDC048998 TaxID=3363976 RepID=UPI0037165148
MRTRTGLGLVLALLLALPAAGCARNAGADDGVATAGGAKPDASASGGNAPRDPKDDQEQFLRFAQCMRDHGIPMDDPDFEGGGVRIAIPDGTDRSKVEAAQEQCKQYMPNGGQPQRVSAEDQEKMRQFSECMREHGITNFPDPSEEGGLMIDGDKLGIDPQSQQFKDAQKGCEQYQPKPPGGAGGEGGKTQHVENGGPAA